MKRALSMLAAVVALSPLAAAAQTPNGRDLAAACAICHGTGGQAQPNMAVLAGVQKEQLAKLVKEFRDGRRPGTIMPQIAKGYTDAQIEAVAAFFAAQKK